jgi:tetratricopeptide (TPR) repeat protein
MRKIWLLVFFSAALTSLHLTGCSRKPVPRLEGADIPADPVAVAPSGAYAASAATNISGAENAGAPLMVPVAPPEPAAQEKYDAALLEALNYVAEKKYTEALVSLGVAKAAQNSDQVQQEIDKVKGLIAQQLAAEQTAQDIKTVITDGKAEDAATLATASLKQYGAGDSADQLAQLKRQADALTAVDVPDYRARQERFRREGEAALAEKNLRAAALAFDQALQCGEDAGLRRQLEELQAALGRYDDNRRRAAELRRDPAHLEEALAALQEAAKAWDTLQVREEMELYALALSKRRSTISVADFEVRGDLGIAYAGRSIAEELLPAFRSRFDLVERGQLSKVIDELRLDSSDLAGNAEGRRELGRLARVQYLVVGSVSPLCGITVNARLVEVRSGLIVQTAKMVARSPVEMLRLMPQLANLLMMTDEQKIAYEQQLVQQSPIVVQPVVEAPLPPPPVFVEGQPVPPPILVYNPRPPAVGGLVMADLEAVPSGGSGISAEFSVEREGPVKRSLLQVAVSLGDNLFRRGRYQEAHRHFELALSISPHEVDLRVRLERCQPHLPPPPPVVVVAPAPVIVVARPRIAVLNFVVNADPGRAPPGFGDWAADQLASYFVPAYEVVDRGELFWYMGRLGLTVRDVATDAAARRWLGRAMNVRFFAFGIVQQTASFDVSTHVVDAESGARQGLGSIHVQDQQDLKLRMAELARQAQTGPAERERLQREAQENERQLNQVRQFLAQGQTAQAIQVSQASLRKNPNDVGMQALLARAEQQAQAAALAVARQQAEQQRQAQAAVLLRQQQQLARAAEAAKQRAIQESTARTEAARRAQEQQRQAAHERLMAQGKAALQQQNAQQALQYFQSAVAIRPGPDGDQALAEARALAARNAQAQAAQEQARRAAELQKQKDADLARARAVVDEQRRRQLAEAQAQRQAQETRDQAAAAKFADQGKKLLAQSNFDAAVTSLQAAQRLHKSSEIEGLINQAVAQSAAQKQDARARADQARRVAEEKTRRDQADTTAAMARQKQLQQQAEAPRKITADAHPAIPKNPPSPVRPPATSPQLKPSPAPNAATLYATQMQLAAALDKQQKYADAANAYQTALKLMPGDVKAMIGLHMAAGQKALAARQFADAAKEFETVLRVSPNHPEATKALKQARQGRP